jgi:hypothetical protein
VSHIKPFIRELRKYILELDALAQELEKLDQHADDLEEGQKQLVLFPEEPGEGSNFEVVSAPSGFSPIRLFFRE